jgi:hypothetical protein
VPAAVSLGVLALVAVALALSAGGTTERALALPVLAASPTDASALRSKLPALAGASARFSQARTIATPTGRGFVVPAPETGQVCLAIPDVVPDSYGQTCVSVAAAQRGELAGTLIAARGAKAGSTFVAVLPAGARSDVRFADGESTTIPVDDRGVASASFTRDATVTVAVDGHEQEFKVYAHEPEGGTLADCDGLAVPLGDGQTRADVCPKQP